LGHELSAQPLLQEEIAFQLTEDFRQMAGPLADRGQGDENRWESGGLPLESIFEAAAAFEILAHLLGDGANGRWAAFGLVPEYVDQRQARAQGMA
jgi:hypothetical protein